MGIKHLLLLGALAFCFVGCSSSEKTEAAQGDCVCETAKTEDGWCETCEVGYVEGNKKACKGCVDAAAAETECEGCAKK